MCGTAHGQHPLGSALELLKKFALKTGNEILDFLQSCNPELPSWLFQSVAVVPACLKDIFTQSSIS